MICGLSQEETQIGKLSLDLTSYMLPAEANLVLKETPNSQE